MNCCCFGILRQNHRKPTILLRRCPAGIKSMGIYITAKKQQKTTKKPK